MADKGDKLLEEVAAIPPLPKRAESMFNGKLNALACDKIYVHTRRQEYMGCLYKAIGACKEAISPMKAKDMRGTPRRVKRRVRLVHS